MEPTIKNGSLVFVWQWIGNVKVGDVVLFKKDKGYWVKRVKKIQGDELVLEGDNSLDSLDSRKLGTINISNIVGEVVRFF